MDTLDVTQAQKSIIDRAYEEYTKDLKNYTHPDDTGFRFGERLAGNDDTRQAEIDDLLNKGILEKDDSDPVPNYRITRKGMSMISAGYPYLGKTITAAYFANKDANSEIVTGIVIEASQLQPRVQIRIDGETAEDTRIVWVNIEDIVNNSTDPFAHLFKIQQKVKEETERQRREEEAKAELEQAAMLRSALKHFNLTVPEDHSTGTITINGVDFRVVDRYHEKAGLVTFTLAVGSKGALLDPIEVNRHPTSGDWTPFFVQLADRIEQVRAFATKLTADDLEEMLSEAKSLPPSETTRYVMVSPDLAQAAHEADELRRDGWALQYAVANGMGGVMECWYRDIDRDADPSPVGDDDQPDADDELSEPLPDKYRIVDSATHAGPMIIESYDLGSIIAPTDTFDLDKIKDALNREVLQLNAEVWNAGEQAAAAVREARQNVR